MIAFFFFFLPSFLALSLLPLSLLESSGYRSLFIFPLASLLSFVSFVPFIFFIFLFFRVVTRGCFPIFLFLGFSWFARGSLGPWSHCPPNFQLGKQSKHLTQKMNQANKYSASHRLNLQGLLKQTLQQRQHLPLDFASSLTKT